MQLPKEIDISRLKHIILATNSNFNTQSLSTLSNLHGIDLRS